MSRDMKIRSFVFVLWLTLLFVSLAHHSPWRDEYQSYLASTRTSTFSEFIEAVRYERHPPLNYLLIRGLNSIAPNVGAELTVQIVSVPFAIGVAVLLLFGLGISLPMAVGFVFTPFLFREFGMISRCYSMGAFFLLLSLYFHLKGKEKLKAASLFFSAGTHLLYTLAAGTILLHDIWERRKSSNFLIRTLPFWIAGFGCLGFVAFQIPPKGSEFASVYPPFGLNLVKPTLIKMAQIFIPVEGFTTPWQWNQMLIRGDICVLFAAIFFWMLPKRSRLWVALIALPGSIILGNIYIPATRHIAVIFFAAYVMYRITAGSKQLGDKTLTPWHITLPVMFASTVFWFLQAMPLNSNGAKFSGTHELIQSGVIQEADIVIAPFEGILFSWMSEQNRNVYSTTRQKWIEIPQFKQQEKIELETWCKEKFGEFQSTHPVGRILLVLPKEKVALKVPESCLPSSMPSIFSSSQDILTDEAFDVYVIRN